MLPYMSWLKIRDMTFTFVFFLLVWVQFSCVVRQHERLFRSLHAYERSWSTVVTRNAPTSYFSIDWIVHSKNYHYGDSSSSDEWPERSKKFLMQINDGRKSGNASCVRDTMVCGPQYWQTTDFCPGKGYGIMVTDFDDILTRQMGGPSTIVVTGATATNTVVPHDKTDVISHIYKAEENDDHLFASKSTINSASTTKEMYWWKNPHMSDACRMERLGPMSLIMNDDSAWGVAAGHSSAVLLFRVALIMFVVNLTAVAQNPAYLGFSASRIFNEGKNSTIVVIVLIVLSMRSMSFSSFDVGSHTMTRTMPNGSYFYVLLAVFLSTYVLVNKPMRHPKDCDDTAVTEGSPPQEVNAAEMEQLNLTPQPGQDSVQDAASVSQGQTTAVSNAGQSAHMPRGLNVSGFIPTNKIQLNAYLTRPAPGKSLTGPDPPNVYKPNLSLGYSAFKGKVFDMASSHFCIAQVFVLPLLTVAVHIFTLNYDNDSNFQIMFWAILTYGLIDVVVHRLTQVLAIYDLLMGSGNTELQKDGHVREVVNMGKVIDLIAIILQTFIAIIIFYCMRWHMVVGLGEMVPIIGDDSTSELFLDWAPAYYIVYFILSNGLKVCTLLNLVRPTTRKSAGNAIIDTYDKVLSGVGQKSQMMQMCLLNAFVVVMLILMLMYQRKKVYYTAFDISMELTEQNAIDQLVAEYRGGWIH